MATLRKRRRQIDVDIEREIIKLSDEHSPTRIHRELEVRFGDRAPHLRTVQRVIADTTPKDAAVWQLRDADPEDAALILPTIGEAIDRTNGRVRTITRGHAAWICTLRRALPSLPPWPAYNLARIYVAQVDRGLETTWIDELLAIDPWGNPQRFRTARRRNWVPLLSPYVLSDLGLLEDQSNG